MRLMLIGSAFLAAAACGGAVSPDPSPTSSSAPASGSSGGARVCTDVACVRGLTVALYGDWRAGDYLFTMTADGVTTVCKGGLPLPSCAEGRALECTDNSAVVGESGCGRPPASQGFNEIRFENGPSNVTIRVERDGAVIADETIAPAYREFQSGGDGCEVACRQAVAAITVDTR